MGFKIFDIGGSYIKTYCSIAKTTSRKAVSDKDIIPLELLKEIIITQVDNNTEYIGLSSQMHGFVLLDEFNNNLSDFVTWKQSSESSIFSEHNIFDKFKLYTGLTTRNDIPINNIYSYIKKNNINNTTIRIKNITEAILDKDSNITHSTMACGHGFYNIHTKQYINEYIDLFYNLFKVKLIFDDVIDTYNIVGTINNIPVYVGIGDFQSSLLGCDVSNNTLFVNMATGSQIASITNTIGESTFSYRPFFKDQYIKCITHIPCGRFLNIFNTFLISCGLSLWDELDKLKLEDIYSSNILVTTDIFKENGVNISNIQCNSFNLQNLIASIFKSFVWQYINIIKNNEFTFQNIYLSGGIAKRIPLIREILGKELNVAIEINPNEDDSISGILKLIDEQRM